MILTIIIVSITSRQYFGKSVFESPAHEEFIQKLRHDPHKQTKISSLDMVFLSIWSTLLGVHREQIAPHETICSSPNFKVKSLSSGQQTRSMWITVRYQIDKAPQDTG